MHVSRHYAQANANANSVYKTLTLLQTTEGKIEPEIVDMMIC